MTALRTRWAAFGAAIAVAVGAGATGQHLAGAAPGPTERPVLVSITPCRLVDTRAEAPVGPRNAPIGPGQTYRVVAHGTNGNCTIPTDAVSLALNVTALNASRSTYLTIWADGAERPAASSLNPTPGQPPTPNAVTTALGAGAFDVFNLAGTVDVIVDVVGYYAAHDHDDRYYTKAQSDTQLADKANAADVYSTDDVYRKDEVDALVAGAGTFEHILVVPGDGTPTANGAALVAAIGTVTSAAPTATSPWMILLEPGRFESSSFPALPAYTTLRGSGRSATFVHDTDEGPAVTASGAVVVEDLAISQGGTSSSASFTHDVELSRVRVITASSSTATAGLSIAGAGVDARLTDVLVDDGDPSTVLGNRWALSVNSGATADLVDSEIDDVYGGLQVGYGGASTVTVRGSRLDANSSSVSIHQGSVTIDDSELTDQIAMGNSSTDVATVEVRNSAMTRVFFNGTGTTGARTVVIESSTMSGGIDGGAGDGATSATIRSTAMEGNVNADSETCLGVTGLSSFFATTCP